MNERTAQMEKMRRGGMTLQQIGDEFGITRERVRQILGKTPRATSCVECRGPLPQDRHMSALICSEACRKERAAKGLPLGECQRCGGPCRGEMCKSCKRSVWDEERAKRWTKLEALWSEGLPMAVIAERLGTTLNALGVEMVRARDAGRDLPYRRAKNPKAADLTKEEARAQFGAALRKGTIRRPNRCEGCGDEGYVDGHHTDYQRPLFVEWLCDECHNLAHGKRSLLKAAA